MDNPKLRSLQSKIDEYTESLQEEYLDFIDCHYLYLKHKHRYMVQYCSAADYLTCGITYCLRHPKFKMCKLKCKKFFNRLFHSNQEQDSVASYEKLDQNEVFEKEQIIIRQSLTGRLNNRKSQGKKKFIRSQNKEIKKIKEPNFLLTLFELEYLRKTLGSSVRFLRFFPEFLFLNLIVSIVPIIPYVIVVFGIFGKKEREYLYNYETFYSREIIKGPPIGVTKKVKLKTHIKMVLFTILFSYGFWTCIYYLSYYLRDSNYFFDIVILSLLNLGLSLVLLLAHFLSGLAGNHHLSITRKQFLVAEMQRIIIDESQFYIEFINYKYGDPIMNYILSSFQNSHHQISQRLERLEYISSIGKRWVDSLDLLDQYLLSFHKHALTKNQLLKHDFMEETKQAILGQTSQVNETDRKLPSQQELIQQEKQFEKTVIYQIFHDYDPELRAIQIKFMDKEFIQNRMKRKMVKQSVSLNTENLEKERDKEFGQTQFKSLNEAQRNHFDLELYKKVRYVKITDLRELYHRRIYQVYSDEYGLNLIRIFAYIFDLCVFLLQLVRIGLPFLAYAWYNEPPYYMENSLMKWLVLSAICVNFVLYEYFKTSIIGTAINRTKQKNALIRLNNMITWQSDQNYFMPKEVPTMNLFCKVSWSSWYNARRMVETIFDVQKNIEDFSYSLIALYGGVIIILMIVDYFGSFWEKNLLFDNQVLTYALGIDVIIITINITVNLIKGCDINYLFEIEQNIIKDFSIFLNYIKTHLTFIYDDEELDDVQHAHLTTAKLRFRQAISLIKREIYLKRTIQYENEKIYEINEKITEEEITIEEISEYIEELSDILEMIQQALEQDYQIRQEKFLGCIPVTYEYMIGIVLTFLPIIASITWQHLTGQQDD